VPAARGCNSVNKASRRERWPHHYFGLLGPGLVTGASDDDPGGIATYSIAGASLGFSTLWTALFTLPLMAAVELTCARIGLISGTGLTGALKHHYPRFLIYGACAALLVANVFNIGADLGGMADTAEMLTGIPALLFVMIFVSVTVVFTVQARYATFGRYIKWTTLVLLTYIGAAIIARPPWDQVLIATFSPEWRSDEGYETMLLAILGTTISPYLFFWQASHEVEAEKDLGRQTRAERRGATAGELADARADVLTGIGFCNLVFYFIVLATASTLYRAGQHDIETTRQAAEALRPLAGEAAYLLFSIGLIGSGLLAIPVLAGSASFAIAELFDWRAGLNLRLRQASRFYVVFGSAVAIGLVLELFEVNPIRMLFLSALVNGLVAPPLLALVMLAANNHDIMGDQTNGLWLNVLGWAVVAIMGVAAVAFLVRGRIA
jgi:NRAMP (natural resistance-associated macrophage protein)-like metal ion transporter